MVHNQAYNMKLYSMLRDLFQITILMHNSFIL